MRTYPHGKCECTTHTKPIPCSHDNPGPAAFKVTRNGKTMNVCTYCDLPDDFNKECLANKDEDLQPYKDFDKAGWISIMGAVGRESEVDVKEVFSTIADMLSGLR